MEKVTSYKLSNGTEIASLSGARLGQQIIDTRKEIHKLKDTLTNLKRQCSCVDKVKSGTPRVDVRTETNTWGDEFGVEYTSQSYSCKVCGADWSHHVEDNQWFKW